MQNEHCGKFCLINVTFSGVWYWENAVMITQIHIHKVIVFIHIGFVLLD